MNTQLKRIAAYFLWKIGHYQRLHSLQRHIYKVLCYHRFVPDGGGCIVSKKYIQESVLKHHLEFIQKHFKVYSLEDCLRYYKKNLRWPTEAISITIDDGYEDLYHYAFPIFKEKKITATVFLVYDFIESRSWLWQDKIKYILRDTAIKGLFNDSVFGDLLLDSYGNVLSSQLRIYNYLIMLPPDQRDEFIEMLGEKCKVRLPKESPRDYAPLSWDQVREMANNGIKFGAHSLSHEVLTNLSAENLKIEIQESKKLIEARLGKEVETFCYPHGMLDERVVRAVQNSGINGAVAGVGANMDYSDTYRLARMYPPGQYKSIFIDSLYRY